MGDSTLEKYESEYFSNISCLLIIGGMGIVASAQFHLDICTLSSIIIPEQKQLPTLLVSCPDIPDRSFCVQTNKGDKLCRTLDDICAQLNGFEVSHIVICCYTYHLAIKDLNDVLKNKLVSLSNYTRGLIEKYSNTILVICTLCSAQYVLFGNDDRLVYPLFIHQQIITDCIISLKTGGNREVIFNSLKNVISHYHFSQLLLGCTDLYVLTPLFEKEYGGNVVINPLKIMSYDIVNNWKNNIKYRG